MILYLVGMAAAALLALGCLIALLIYFDPFIASLSILILFYLALFISLSGVLFFIGFSLRRISHRRGVAIWQFTVSFGQGILLSVILVGVLILQRQRMLFWWSLVALVVGVGLVEWWAMKR